MTARPGTPERPARVAVVGAGPAGFYTVAALLQRPEACVDVDLFERLPAPYGLLRYGVAPDHPTIKSVAVGWKRFVENPHVRYLGNVGVGHGPLSVADLRAHYDQVVFTTGCESDRRLDIPGEDLPGSHAARSFVAWYNGHPDFTSLAVDLSCERAVVVGVGDVAMDLARILLRSPDELASTDIAPYALDLLRRSRIREVVLLARRGPAEAAFAAKELEDIGELDGVGVSADETLLGRALETIGPGDTNVRRKLEVLGKFTAVAAGAPRRLTIRFLTSPVEILAGDGRVAGVRIEHNELATAGDGSVIARGTGRTETIDAGLVIRSVGYFGVPIDGLPFDAGRGVVPNVDGRVAEGGDAGARLYVAGWIKRGATGVVGTNKADAAATVARMLEDLPSLPARDPATVSRDAIDALLHERGARVVTWKAWRHVDLLECARGAESGKLREKLTSVAELLEAAGA